jgi:hypothetical protein
MTPQIGFIPQSDTPPRFGASLWSDGREVIVVGNTLTEALENLRKEWESK